MDTQAPKKSLKRHDSLARMVAESSRKKVKRVNPLSSRLCGHCNQNLALKVYKKHERLYRKPDQSWILSDDVGHQSGLGSGFEMEPSLPTFSTILDVNDGGELMVTEQATETLSLSNDDTEVDYTTSEDELLTDYSESDGEEVWDMSDDQSDDDLPVQTGASISVAPSQPIFHASKEYQSAQSLLKWIVGFLFILQAKYHIPNAAIDLLIKFMFALVCVLSRFSPFVCHLRKSFPQSLHAMRKSYSTEIAFVKYPVCPKCTRVYDSYESCIERVGSMQSSKLCSHVQFPKHPHRSRRTACKTLLLKSVQFRSGKTILYPFKVYCYRGLKSSLQNLLMRPAFLTNCELWRSRPENGLLSDIYDGKIWREFLNVAGSPFLAASFSFGLMLNIDWFQPYTHTVNSVGVIYLTIMNLPRTLRFKLENLILIGIIPGPSEPSHDINPYLDPLVSELLDFWSGVKLRICSSSGVVEEIVKCALLCVCCDLPAARKSCGFLSYTARLGCSRCLKEFPGRVGDVRDFSGFDRSQWKPRSDTEHRVNVAKLKKCKSKSELEQNESKLGCRYSCLLDLPYFSPTRFLTIDPMHNLFLGTGKRILLQWIELKLLDKAHFEQIQHFVDNMVVPSDVGRIPSKIASGFAGFKADQFKTWITIYSIPALFDILPQDHYEYWRHFVLACRILCKQSLRDLDITLADSLLLQFCKRVTRLYGKTSITPNMHLHGHLKDVVQDYGPIHEFWCYSFERFNGILGKQPTNNRAIEPQLLKQFLLDNASSSYNFPCEFKNDFASLDLNNVQRSKLTGSVLDTITKDEFLLPARYKRCVLSLDDIEQLQKLYLILHPEYSNISVNRVYKKYSSITLKGKVYRSSGLKNQHADRLLVVLASWNQSVFGPPPTSLPDAAFHSNSNYRPINVLYYITATCRFTCPDKPEQECQQEWTLAHVSWLFPHPKRYHLGKPAELWCSIASLSESFGIHSFVPLDLLLSRCAHGPFTLDNESLLVVVPLSAT